VPVGHAKFDVNRFNESPLRSENPDFWPASKFNTDSVPLCGILPPVITTLYWYHDADAAVVTYRGTA